MYGHLYYDDRFQEFFYQEEKQNFISFSSKFMAQEAVARFHTLKGLGVYFWRWSHYLFFFLKVGVRCLFVLDCNIFLGGGGET